MVNVAARMESLSEPGSVMVHKTTLDRHWPLSLPPPLCSPSMDSSIQLVRVLPFTRPAPAPHPPCFVPSPSLSPSWQQILPSPPPLVIIVG